MSDVRFRRLRIALHSDLISLNTRDGFDGVRLLQNDYGLMNITYVGDPALWAGKVYNIKKKTNKEIVVGINMIRPDIYQSYGKPNSVNSLILLYNDLLAELTKRGYKWRLFCNGMKEDYSLYARLSYSGNEGTQPVIPSTTQELLHTIASFDYVVGFRLHACIAAVALDIPVVGMIWDDKSKFFSKSMGIERYFVEPDQLSALRIVDLIEEQMKEPVCYSNKADLQRRCTIAISEFLSKCDH